MAIYAIHAINTFTVQRMTTKIYSFLYSNIPSAHSKMNPYRARAAESQFDSDSVHWENSEDPFNTMLCLLSRQSVNFINKPRRPLWHSFKFPDWRRHSKHSTATLYFSCRSCGHSQNKKMWRITPPLHSECRINGRKKKKLEEMKSGSEQWTNTKRHQRAVAEFRTAFMWRHFFASFTMFYYFPYYAASIHKTNFSWMPQVLWHTKIFLYIHFFIVQDAQWNDVTRTQKSNIYFGAKLLPQTDGPTTEHIYCTWCT